MRIQSILALLTLLLPGVAHADEDTQIWAAAVAQGAVKGDLFVFAEAQSRITDDASRAGQWIVRPAAGVRFAPDSTVLAGYAYVRTDPANGAASDEHRLWQQLQLPLLRAGDGAVLIVNRTRIEQRMFEGRDDTGWRLRQMIRVQLPIARGGAVQAIASSEGFFNLNATDWGARRGVDQWRNFVGIGLPVGKRFRIEPGYLNQRVFRRGEDRTNHAFFTTLFYRI